MMKKFFPKMTDEGFGLCVLFVLAIQPYLFRENFNGSTFAFYNLCAIVLTFCTMCASYICYTRIFDSAPIGLLCSALYTLSTYCTYVLCVKGDLGEAAAMVFLPYVLLGIYRLFCDRETKSFLRKGWPIGIGLSGYVLMKVLCPAEVSGDGIQLVQNRGIQVSHMAFQFWQDGRMPLTEDNGLETSLPVGLGFVLVLGILVFLVLWFGDQFREDGSLRLKFLKGSAILELLFLMMSSFFFPWDHLTLLHPMIGKLVALLESPQRMIGFATPLAVLVAGYCLWHFKQKEKWQYLVAAIVVTVCMFTSTVYMTEYLTSDYNALIDYEVEQAIGEEAIGEEA